MVDLADARVVAVLTRAPSSGGKTRLFAALGRPVDRALLEALLLDTLDGVRLPGTAVVVAVDPPHAAEEVERMVAPGVAVVAQPPGTLGERMRAVMASCFERGARAVALVGSDLPEIQADAVAQAFCLLEEDPETLVLGPAADGGYYLVAAASVPDVFDGIAWGSGAVLAQTVAAAARTGRRVRLIGPLSDIDTVQDLNRLRTAPAGQASRTARWVRARLPGDAGGAPQ